MFLNYPDFKVWALDIEVEVYVAKPYHSQCFTSDLIHSLNIIFLWSISFIQLLVFAKSWKIRVILKGWIHILYGFKNFKIIFKVERFLLNPDWQYMVVELIECSLVKIFLGFIWDLSDVFMVHTCLTRVQIQFLKSSFNVHSGENGEILRIGFLKLFNKKTKNVTKFLK